MGERISNKKLTDILRNPFYCGYISHNLLDGEIAKGKHEALISEEIFLKANDILKRIAYGYKHLEQNENIPLKNFVICAACGTPMTGDWCRRHNVTKGQVLTINNTWELAKVWYGNYLGDTWTRKTPEYVQSLFEKVGLTGEFWKMR